MQGVFECTAAADFFEETGTFVGSGAFAGHRCSQPKWNTSIVCRRNMVANFQMETLT
jgi:hypothetical protein